MPVKISLAFPNLLGLNFWKSFQSKQTNEIESEKNLDFDWENTDNNTQLIEADSPNTLGKTMDQSAWTVFISTFLTIFVAELGDKTQVTTLLMTAESHSPWIVFAGAGVALVTTSFLGVLLGRWLGKRLSPKTLEKASGIMLLIISVSIFWDIFY